MEASNSDKNVNGSETADSVEQFNSEEPNQLNVKRLKRCQHCDNEGADKGLTRRQADRRGRDARNRRDQEALDRRVEERGTEPDEDREQGVETEGKVECGLKKNLKLSLRESVEIQAQHWPDRLHKPRTGSVWTDRLGRIGA